MPNLQKFTYEVTMNYDIQAEDMDKADEVLDALLEGQHVSNGRLVDQKIIVMKWS